MILAAGAAGLADASRAGARIHPLSAGRPAFNLPAAATPPTLPMRFLFGPLTRHRQCRVPTWRGAALLLLLLAAMAAGLGRHLLGALSPTERVAGGILVVEGWLPDYALAEAMEECRRSACRRIHTTGGAVPRGSALLAYGTHAEIAAAVLRHLGMPPDAVVAVPTPPTAKDRTHASAVALREWLAGAGIRPGAVQVVTLGAHARRTRLLYQKAFGETVPIGIVAVPSRDFEAERWWASSEGVRVVMAEGIAYLYARFSPGPD